MKWQLLIAAALLIAGSGLLFAQETTIPPESDPNEVNGPTGTPCPMCMMMAGHLFKSELIATTDGGVLLMIGGTLYKYDANLALVAETQLQLDPQQIQTQLQQLISNCPACQQKMQMQRQWRGGRRFNGFRTPENGVTEGDGIPESNGAAEQKEKSESDGQTDGAAESESLQEYGQPDSESQTPETETDELDSAKQPEETRL